MAEVDASVRGEIRVEGQAHQATLPERHDVGDVGNDRAPAVNHGGQPAWTLGHKWGAVRQEAQVPGSVEPVDGVDHLNAGELGRGLRRQLAR